MYIRDGKYQNIMTDTTSNDLIEILTLSYTYF